MTIVTIVNAAGRPVYSGDQTNEKTRALALRPDNLPINGTLPESHLSAPYKWNGSDWILDSEAREAHRVAKARIVTKRHFMERFKDEELDGIYKAAHGDPFASPSIPPNSAVSRIQRDLLALDTVDLRDSKLTGALDTLVSKGLLTPARRDAVLAI